MDNLKVIVLIGGILMFLLLSFQILSGLKIIKVPFIWHKRGAIALFLFAIVHAMIGVLFVLGLL